MRDFLEAYALSNGGMAIGEADATKRIVQFAVARLLHVATEWAEYSSSRDVDDDASLIVEHARDLLRTHEPMMALLQAWSKP